MSVKRIPQLSHYFSIVDKKKPPKYYSSDLEKKKERALEVCSPCVLCERRCRVERLRGIKGFCGVSNQVLIADEFLHLGEEEFLIPSHTIFFMGCNLDCQFCQNWRISKWMDSNFQTVTPKTLARILFMRYEQGARNINLVGGEPTPYLPWIIEALEHAREKDVRLPIVWNSNMYMTPETMEVLDGIVDLYLADYKFGNNECAERLAITRDYTSVVQRNLLEAARQTEVCIRHLVMPEHYECCTLPVLEWIAENLGDRVTVSILGTYRPYYHARYFKDIGRSIEPEEVEKARETAKNLGLVLVD